MTTTWSDERLQRLFARYNRKYWNGRVPQYEVVNRPMPEESGNAIGLCQRPIRRLIVEVNAHTSDPHVRSTLLHEMCHAAAGRRERPVHGSRFFEQLERLLRMKDPVTVGAPEAGNRKGLDPRMVPKRFKLCRAAIKLAAARAERAIAAEIAEIKDAGTLIHETSLTKEMLAQEVYDAAAIEGLNWLDALRGIGEEYGLLDIDGKPLFLPPDWIKVIRSAHRRGRQFWLDNKKAERLFAALQAKG